MGKKVIYIILFTFLGIILQLLLHALVENLYIKLLTTNFSRYSLGLSWAQWFTIHYIGTIILFVIGALLGFWQGIFWWKKIYK